MIFQMIYLQGQKKCMEMIEFHWIPLVQLNNIKIYPEKTADLMMKLDSGVQHFIDKEI